MEAVLYNKQITEEEEEAAENGWAGGPAGQRQGQGEGDLSSSSLTFQVLIGTLYAVIFLLGVFGNALVCFAVARNRQMQTVTNLFITNLALGDILMCVLAVPFTPLYTFLGSWVFGDTLCHLVPYAQGCSVYVSTLTLTCIALDRFLVIHYPFRPRMRVASCLGAILLIWCVALLLTLPYGLYMQPQAQRGKRYCEEAWPDEPLRMLFSSATSVLQFVLPFLAIALCYVCVSLRLSERARAKPGASSSRRQEAERERKRRTNRMLVAMVAIFAVSWLPLNLVNVLEDFRPSVVDYPYYKLLFFLAHCLAMSSTCYNPFLYAWLNDNFRKEFKMVLPCFGPVQSSQRFADRGEEAGCFNRSERTCCNGPDQITLQESLVPTRLPAPKQYSACEMISLEPTTNLTKDAD